MRRGPGVLTLHRQMAEQEHRYARRRAAGRWAPEPLAPVRAIAPDVLPTLRDPEE